MGFVAIIVAAIALGAPSDAAVRADWAALGQPSDVRYLSLDAMSQPRREKWAQAMAFAIPSASRAENVDRQVPQRVGQSNAYRIDLTHLEWGQIEYAKVLTKYPYAAKEKNGSGPLVIRADWLMLQLADQRDSQAYPLLLYGENAPKTDAEFLKAWGVEATQQRGQSFGWIETKSQVNLQETRFIEHFNAGGQSLWRTLDTQRVGRGSDPLESLDGKFKFDGKELIAQVAKTSARYRSRGCSQVYFLANGDGKAVNEAPVRLVEDHKRTLGQTAILNPGSCTICHSLGMQFPTENGLSESLKIGEVLKVYDKRLQEQYENFHLGDSQTTLQRNNENYSAFVHACNQLDTATNANLYRLCLLDYRQELTLKRAAGELYCEPEELRLALGYASANNIVMPSRIAGLAHGRKVSRDTWEDYYVEVKAMLDVWRQGGQK